MTTAFSVPDVEQELTRFGIADAAIEELGKRYLPLKIDGLDDKKNYAMVHSARMIVRSKRTDIERVRKELKADALEFGRKVDGEAKRLTALLEPIETHLEQQEFAIDTERERLKNLAAEQARLKAEAEEKARQEAEAKRIADERAEAERLLRVERERLAAERAEMEAEQKRQRAELLKGLQEMAEAKAAEEAKLQAERDRLAEVARVQKEAQDKIDAEARRVAQEAAEKAHAEETARIQAEAAERARVETEARLKREAEEKEAKRIEAEKKAAAKAAKIEAARPDVQKINAMGSLLRSIQWPAVKGGEATAFLNDIYEEIQNIATKCEAYKAE